MPLSMQDNFLQKLGCAIIANWFFWYSRKNIASLQSINISVPFPITQLPSAAFAQMLLAICTAQAHHGMLSTEEPVKHCVSVEAPSLMLKDPFTG